MRELFRAALICAVVFILNFCLDQGPAFAVDTTTGSAVDLAPVLNPLIQGVGIVIAGCLGTIAVFAVNWVRRKMNLSALEVDAALQAKIDAGAQKFVGGLIAKAGIAPGKIMLDTRSAAVNEAANKFATAFGETLGQIGTKDNVEKAKEIIVNRLGMMAAAAQGTPVPNPSAAVTAVAPVPVPVAVPAATPGKV